MHREIKGAGARGVYGLMHKSEAQEKREPNRLLGSEEKSGGGISGEPHVFVAQTESINQKTGLQSQSPRLNMKEANS